ncbi:hypothetical protein ACQKGC_15690 [Allorhizobium pseudoryzae]|uniref:hypothetical protein n=1 Tax=Allorhizobium pseudoryzae TaxID=379684 RepID=UPI003CFFDCAA
MTIFYWPTDLPKPERNTWSASYTDPRLRRAAEAPTPAYRRRFSSVARPVQLSMLLDRNLKAVFERFYEETTAYGSLPFYMPDPTTDGWALLASDGRPLLTSAGVPLLLAARWLCLFGDTPPSEVVVGVEFRISFSVSVMP